MRIRPARKSTPTASRKSFSSIPRSFSRAIDKKRFSRQVLGDFFGGNIKGSMDPLKRKDVRSVLEEAGVLGMLDTSASGPRSTHATKLTEKEAIDILKKARETLHKNLKAKGYGVREEGKFLSKDPKTIYKKVVENAFQGSGGMTVAEQLREKEQMRVVRARRREIARQDLGLSSIKKLAQDKTTRREDLEQRLETMRSAQHPSKAKQDPTTPQSATGPKAAPRPSSSRTGTGVAYLPPVQPSAGGDDEESSIPPRVPNEATKNRPLSPQSSEENPTDTDTTENPQEDEDVAPPQPDRRIEENLPL